MAWQRWPAYVPVAERRARAARELRGAKKRGVALAPVVIEGKSVASTFWGKAWCENLERYADFANRIERGLRYVRNGSVIDLKIESGRVEAQVMGSELYAVGVEVAPLAAEEWGGVKEACAGGIATLVELLEGKLSDAVMKVVTEPGKGLFPRPKELRFSCSCPDSAKMCKHVAATLYGIGARFDRAPELLFALRGVDAGELVAQDAGRAVAKLAKRASASPAPRIKHDDLGALFGIDLKMGGGKAALEKKAAGSGRGNKKKARGDGKRNGPGNS
ncbi:MAG: hypothetical protein J0L75_03190 [Spirochaetes bacterium]|nr:hypothetical protein [Spirochaetota bacterium]